MPLHVSSACVHHQEVKIALYKASCIITLKQVSGLKLLNTFYKYKHIVVKFMCEFFGCDYCVLLFAESIMS